MSRHDDPTLDGIPLSDELSKGRVYAQDQPSLRPAAARTSARMVRFVGAAGTSDLIGQSTGDGRPHTWLVRLFVTEGALSRIRIHSGQDQAAQDSVDTVDQVHTTAVGSSPCFLVEGQNVDVVVTTLTTPCTVRCTITPDPTVTPPDAIPGRGTNIRIPPETTTTVPSDGQFGTVVQVAEPGSDFSVSTSVSVTTAVAINTRLVVLGILRALGGSNSRVRRVDVTVAGGNGGLLLVGLRKVDTLTVGTDRTADIVPFRTDEAVDGAMSARQGATVTPSPSTAWVALWVIDPSSGRVHTLTYIPERPVVLLGNVTSGFVVETVVQTALTTSPAITASIEWSDDDETAF